MLCLLAVARSPRLALLTVLGAWIALSAATFPAAATAAEATLSLPTEVEAGAEFQVSWTGPGDEKDFISIDPEGAPESRYGLYEYVREGSPLTLRAPGTPGSFSVRYHLGGSPYPVIASSPLEVVAPAADLQAPDSVSAGETVTITWSGPDGAGDFLSIDDVGAPDSQYGRYVYTNEGNPVELVAPEEPGRYALRYHLGVSGYGVVAIRPIVVTDTAATLEAPERADAGSEISIGWTGPGREKDFISLDEVGAPDSSYGRYVYVVEGNPVELTVPDEPGRYLVRYHLGTGGYRVVASAPIEVGRVEASVAVEGPVVAGEPFEVTWTGPDHESDFLTIVPADTREGHYENYAYTRRGSPLRLLAPDAPGAYEVRYATGQDFKTLGRAAVEVTPSQARGTLRVVSSTASTGGELGGVGAVEVILDASGSMLQRLDGTRRIELARRALLDLTGDALPDGVPFALRVFGHREADSCRTDLEIPLGPLDRGEAAATLRSVDAKNLAKTPIADSLRMVRDDLAGADGPRLVVLVTDGEETCGGDPAEVIRDLAASGIEVRVNIVGFAIDELMLKEEFERWARLGGGRYLDASDGDALQRAVRGALRPTFEILSSSEVVATGTIDGEPVELKPGSYGVREAGGESLGSVTIAAKEETILEAAR